MERPVTAELDAVLAEYHRTDPTRTLGGRLDRTRLAHAAYVVANEGRYDERGMPVGTFRERIAAGHTLLERIAPELDVPAPVEMAREHA